MVSQNCNGFIGSRRTQQMHGKPFPATVNQKMSVRLAQQYLLSCHSPGHRVACAAETHVGVTTDFARLLGSVGERRSAR